MKRSEINQLIRAACHCFQTHCWALPPNASWDVTDFGLGDWQKFGLVLVNLAEEPEYCEKLMYAQKGMRTPAHCHRQKKEDIICRWGKLAVRVWPGAPGETATADTFTVPMNHEPVSVRANEVIELNAGSRVTFVPGIYHEFEPLSDECIIGEVSTANDDQQDNYFANPDVGRFPGIEEDETPIAELSTDTRTTFPNERAAARRLCSPPRADGSMRFWRMEQLWELAKGLPVKKVRVRELKDFDEVRWYGGPLNLLPTCRSVAEHARDMYAGRSQPSNHPFPRRRSRGRNAQDLQGISVGD